MPTGSGKRIGYALGGGAARGLAHIGVLKVLEEHGIFPDIIAGTSMGALVGALYAGGLKVSDIEHFALRLHSTRLALLADMTPSLSGLVGGKRVVALLKSILGDLTFDQLKYDFACVTTDIQTGEQVLVREGSLTEAVRASLSLPGIFTPVKMKERYLVDGGLVNEVPVSVCREMGAEYVIGVNVIPEPARLADHSAKRTPAQAHDSVKSTDDGNDSERIARSHAPSKSLRGQLAEFDGAVHRFLLHRQPAEIKKVLSKPVDWVREDMPKRLRRTAPSLVEVLTQTVAITEYRIAVENLEDADLAIHPDIEGIGFWQFTKAAAAIALGEEATRHVIQQQGGWTIAKGNRN